jgi:signal transduction histidine kinase
MQNLIINAIDGIRCGGKLAIRTERRNGSQRFVRLEVKESGAEFASNESERLLPPRPTASLCGSGLALAIVQSIVSAYGGRITIRAGTGTRLLRLEFQVNAVRE